MQAWQTIIWEDAKSLLLFVPSDINRLQRTWYQVINLMTSFEVCFTLSIYYPPLKGLYFIILSSDVQLKVRTWTPFSLFSFTNRMCFSSGTISALTLSDWTHSTSEKTWLYNLPAMQHKFNNKSSLLWLRERKRDWKKKKKTESGQLWDFVSHFFPLWASQASREQSASC